MEAYTGFAAVYDIFMDNVPYEEWSSYLHGLLLEHGIEEGIVLDLGCGTGAMTERLAAFGYDMIGVDNSEDMLELAMEKRVQSGQDILYLLQDMREFELYDDEEKINEYDLTLFIREEGKEKNLYRKYQETHYQRGYTLDEMKELIQSSGLIFETAYDAFTHEAPTEKSERIYIIAREYGKLQK